MSLRPVFVRDGERCPAHRARARALGSRALSTAARRRRCYVRALEGCEPADGPAAGAGHLRVLRPVPLGPLAVRRRGGPPGPPGACCSEASIRDPDGTEVVRARALRVRPSELGRRRRTAAAVRGRPFPGPARGGRTTSPAPIRRCSPPTRWRSASSRASFLAARAGDGVVSAAPAAGRRRAAHPAAAAGRRRRLRQRDRLGAVVGRARVHQPRPDAVLRARAARGMGRAAVARRASPPGAVAVAESVLCDERGGSASDAGAAGVAALLGGATLSSAGRGAPAATSAGTP